MKNIKSSIDRAVILLNTPCEYDKYVYIKIIPVPHQCCCFHCLPGAWDIINEQIYPMHLEDEGDVLIEKNDEKFVLECHESGPEIISYLGLGIGAINLIINLVKAIQNEKHKRIGRLKIVQCRMIKTEFEEEKTITEIELPLSNELIKKLNETLKDAIEKKD